MPELPEVETLRRDLERTVVGRRIVAAQTSLPKLFAEPLGPDHLVGRTVEALRRLYPLGSTKTVFAVDETGRYAGLVDMSIIHDPDQDAAATETRVGSLACKADAVLLPGDDARTVLNRFGSAEVEALPVLSSPTDRRIIGYVTESFALRRYSQALERQRGEDLGERGLWGRD